MSRRAAARHLGSQFAASTVTKEYEAIVHGAPEEDEFVVNVPIGRKLDSEISLRRVAGKAEGASPARTAFLVVARGTDRSHLHEEVETVEGQAEIEIRCV